MGAQLRIYRRRVRAVQSIKKIAKAMELIAASRIVKARTRMQAARPYAEELTRALAALGRNASLTHPMLTGVGNPQRTGILLITSDRGLAGGYSANAIRTANDLSARMRREGKEPVLYVIGRRGVGYYRFRHVDIAGSWTGFSEQPTFLDARDATETVVGALSATSEGESRGKPGIDELYVVYTQLISAVTQTPTAQLIAPLNQAGDVLQAQDEAEQPSEGQPEEGGVVTPPAEYEFEPEPAQLIEALMPRYVSARIFSALLEAAASESASRRRAMKAANDNAEELIRMYSRLANQARQAEITQEISEIVGGADALAAAGSEQS